MLVILDSSLESGNIDSILRKRYATLNRQLQKKRLKEQEELNPLDQFLQLKVESNEPSSTVDELQEINSNQISKTTAIKIAYRFLQRLCDTSLQLPQNLKYFKIMGLQIYKNQ